MRPMDDMPIRIGDADRDRAIERLRTAMAEGRLTFEEFDQRVEAALQAKFESDLAPLFADLPAEPGSDDSPAVAPDRPVQFVPPMMLPPGRRYHRAGFYLPLWPITFFVLFASGFRLWWLILVPLVLGPVIMGGQRRGRRDDRWQLPPR